MNNLQRLYVFAVLLGVGVSALTPTQKQDIDDFVDKAMSCWNVPGLSLAAVKDGKTVLTRGYGKADVEKDIDFNDKTVFPIASMTKQFSATLLGILLKEKGIPWRTKVKDILDDFVMPSDYMTLHTTIEDIISHRTGLNEAMALGQFTMQEAYDRIRLYSSAVDFREEILYSGIMFSVSGIIAEKLGGKRFRDLMKERVFDPLEMGLATMYDYDLLDRDDVARPYMAEVVDGPLIPVDPMVGASTRAAAPAGGIAASAKCMAKYMEFLTNGGKATDGSTLLSKDALDELFQPLMVLPQPWLGGFLQLPVSPFPRTLDAYAHGWMLGYYRGLRNVYHFGDIYGFDGLVSIFPERQVGVFSMSNGPNGRRAVLANLLIQNYVTDVLLDHKPWLNISSVCDYRDFVKGEIQSPPPPSSEIDKTIPQSRPLQEYTGVFGNLAVGNFTVLVNESTGDLQADFPPLVKFALYPTKSADQFAVENFGHMTFMRGLSTKDNPGALAIFSTNDGGKIDSVEMSMFGLTFYRDLKYNPDDVKMRKEC